MSGPNGRAYSAMNMFPSEMEDQPKKKEGIKVKVSMSIEIQDFTVPAYVIQIQQPGLKQDGFKPSEGIPLRELDEKTLDQLCRNFRREVFRKAERQDPEDRK